MVANVATRVRAQYERHPYPPVSPFALPARRPERELSASLGAELAGIRDFPRRPRVLVAGCGSLEALIVARANPEAELVTAVDLSEASLRILGRRLTLARFAQPFATQAPIATHASDLLGFRGGPFDAIFLSNVLQHVAAPEQLLEHLVGMLAPHGVLRLVVYPRASRLWMNAIQAHLRTRGLDAQVSKPRARVTAAMRELPTNDPLRLSFEVNPESTSDAGVVDAYLHEHDEPVAPLALAACAQRLGMRLVAERQTPSSQSAFVEEVDPALAARITSPWDRLAVLDASLELCANPVLWFTRGTGEPALGAAKHALPPAATLADRLGACLSELDRILAFYSHTSEAWLTSLAREVGPRVSAPPDEKPLPGLALSDYDVAALREGSLRLRAGLV